jgi:hypothetical protein
MSLIHAPPILHPVGKLIRVACNAEDLGNLVEVVVRD